MDRSWLRRHGDDAYGRLVVAVGDRDRARMVVVLACVLGLSGADTSTVGASAGELRAALHVGNMQVGLLVTASSIVGAVATLPFGVLADRVRRTTALAAAIVLWGGVMLWSATVETFDELLVARLALGAVTAAAGPLVASLIGDAFETSQRGRIYGLILSGELVGAGFGFAVTGDVAALAWQAAFVALAVPAFALAWFVLRLPEPRRRDVRHVGGHAHPQQLSLVEAARVVLRVRTNVLLIASGALAYYFLAGVQTFGNEFMKRRYGVDQPLANALLLVVGIAAVAGTIASGALGDLLVQRGRVAARITIAAAAAAATTVFFLPAIFAHSALGALPYLAVAVFALSAQNPAVDATRLDVVPPPLWGRAESVRSVLRALAQALAPLVFGAVADHLLGLQWTFVVMLLPLAGSAALLFRARRTYPGDIVAAAAGGAVTPAPALVEPRRA